MSVGCCCFDLVVLAFYFLAHGFSSGHGPDVLLLSSGHGHFPSDFRWNVVQSDFSSNDFSLHTSENGGTRSLWCEQSGSGFVFWLQNPLVRVPREKTSGITVLSGIKSFNAGWRNISNFLLIIWRNSESENCDVNWSTTETRMKDFWVVRWLTNYQSSLWVESIFVHNSEMFRQLIFQIFSRRALNLIRNSYTSTASSTAAPNEKILLEVIVQDLLTKPIQEIDLNALFSELSKMKSFELKIVTTRVYLKVDNS